MNTPEVTALLTSLERLKSIRTEIWGSLSKAASDGTEFNLSLTPSGMSMNLSEMDLLIGAFSDFTTALSASKNAVLMPRGQITALTANLDHASAQLQTIVNIFQQGIRSISDPTSITVATEQGNSYTLGSYFTSASSYLDEALTHWLILRSAAGSPRYRDFSTAFATLNNRRIDIDTALRETKELESQIEHLNLRANEIFQLISEKQSDADRLHGVITQQRQTINEYTNEAGQKLESIRALFNKAEGLEAEIETYEHTFTQFQTQLDARNNQFVQQSANLTQLTQDLTEKQREADRLVTEAEGMLKGATNAGLAATFSAREQAMNSEVRGARHSFYFSIAILLVVSIPLAAYILPRWIVEAFMPKGLPFNPADVLGKPLAEQNTTEVVSQILARALLLIPGIWLVRFAASRHERLFKLREHYAYKYSIASSVEGFKKQAPAYKEEIAATSFYELTFNPATSMEGKSPESRHPNPLLEALMRRIEGKAESDKRARSAG